MTTTTECPKCGHGHIDTVDSRHVKGDWRRRRKHCRSCHYKWSTLEIPEQDLTQMLKFGELIEQMRELLHQYDSRDGHVRGKPTTQKISNKFWTNPLSQGAIWNPDGVD